MNTRTMLLRAALSAACRGAANQRFEVNDRTLVSRADLDYRAAASRPEEGMPVGNGR